MIGVLQDYRNLWDGIRVDISEYQPDPDILKRCRAIDPDIDIKWLWFENRWGIFNWEYHPWYVGKRPIFRWRWQLEEDIIASGGILHPAGSYLPLNCDQYLKQGHEDFDGSMIRRLYDWSLEAVLQRSMLKRRWMKFVNDRGRKYRQGYREKENQEHISIIDDFAKENRREEERWWKPVTGEGPAPMITPGIEFKSEVV